MKISEIMRSPVAVVHESDSIERAAVLMLQHDLRGLPVVDDKGEISGFISVSDFLAREKGFPFTQFRALQLFGKWIQKGGVEHIYEDARSLPVSKIMSSPAYTVQEDDTVEDFLKLVVERGFSRMPVVRARVPVGIVARFDLLKLMCNAIDGVDGVNSRK
jgi:CBS domain-containing protein